MRKFLLLTVLGVGLAGCGGRPQLVGSPSITVIEASSLPAPDGSPAERAALPYRVGANDKLLVDVAGIEALKDREFQTDISGDLALPLAGRIHADGMTLAQLESVIEAKLRAAHVRRPDVSVNPIETKSQVVTVDGSVTQPGLYPVTQDTTLMKAVASAKGVSEFARLNDVVVFRKVGDKQMVALFNLGAIRRGLYPDPRIFAGDTVVVGESGSRRLFQNIVQAGALITAPIIAFLNTQ